MVLMKIWKGIWSWIGKHNKVLVTCFCNKYWVDGGLWRRVDMVVAHHWWVRGYLNIARVQNWPEITIFTSQIQVNVIIVRVRIKVRVVRVVRAIGLVKMVRVARVVCVALWASILKWQSLTRCSGLATKGSYRTAWASKQIQVLIYHHIWYHLINIIIIKLWLKLTTLSSSVRFVHVVLTLQDSDCVADCTCGHSCPDRALARSRLVWLTRSREWCAWW